MSACWCGRGMRNGVCDGLAERFRTKFETGSPDECWPFRGTLVRGYGQISHVNPAHLEPVPMTENLRRSNAYSAVNSRKETCPSGHEYDRIAPRSDGRTYRVCRICYNAAQRARRAARKEAAA